MWPLAIWKQSWNNWGNPFTKSYGWKNFENVQKSSQNDHLLIDGACVGMLVWKIQKKIQGINLVCSFLGKLGSNHLI
jgi:hypothetical protein